MPHSLEVGEFVFWWKRGTEPHGVRVLGITPRRVRIVETLHPDFPFDPDGESRTYVRPEHISRPGFRPETTAGGGAFDPFEEVPGLVSEAIIEYPLLRPMWLALLRRSVQIGMAYDRWGTIDCTIRIEDAEGGIHEFFQAASDTTPAIWGCIREAFSSLTDGVLPFDSDAYFDDFVMD